MTTLPAPAETPIAYARLVNTRRERWEPERWERGLSHRRRRGPVNIDFRLPVALIWAVVAPVVVIALPLITFYCLERRQVPAKVLWSGARMLHALGGTKVEVESRRARINLQLI